MLESQRVDGAAFISVESVRAPSFVADDGDAGAGEQAAQVDDTVTSAVANRKSVRNAILRDVRIRSGDAQWQSTRRLRVTIETYDDADVLVYLVEEPAFVGHGSSVAAALEDLLDEIEHDLHFYRDATDSDLTKDAVATMTLLGELFQASRET